MKKRKSFSLIEVLVCLSLLSLLLTTLFYWYHNLSRQKEALAAVRGPLMEERYLHQRLQCIIPKVESPFFLAEDNGLVFIFDRGPALISELSGKVLAKLYHDSATSSLCLTLWPQPKKEAILREPTQTYVLLDGVTHCSFEFYHPPDPYKKPVDPQAVGRPMPVEGWQNQWHPGYATLPALVKIVVAREARGDPLEYLFDFPIPIIYPENIA